MAKYPKTLGRIEAVWNKLGGEEGVDLLLAGEGVVPRNEMPDPNVPAVFFRMREGLWVSPDFQTQMLAKVANTGTEVRHIDLECDMSSVDIEAMLGNSYVFGEMQVCLTIARLITAQPNGVEGELLNNGFLNLFYTSSCVVRVYWRVDRREWFVGTWWRGDGGWCAGSRAFSPATDN